MIEEYLRTRGATICPPRFAGATVHAGRPAKTIYGGQDLNASAVYPRFIERGFE